MHEGKDKQMKTCAQDMSHTWQAVILAGRSVIVASCGGGNAVMEPEQPSYNFGINEFMGCDILQTYYYQY